MATTAELIEDLQFIARFPANVNAPFICRLAAERLETLYNERMAAAGEIDRVEAKYKALLEKAKADMPHKCCKDEYNDIRVDEVLHGASNIINRLQAEVERLQNKCEDCAGCTQWLCDCANERNYVVEKFAERAKEKLRDIARVDFQGNYYYLIGESFFEDLAKEMKEYLAKEMECDAE